MRVRRRVSAGRCRGRRLLLAILDRSTSIGILAGRRGQGHSFNAKARRNSPSSIFCVPLPFPSAAVGGISFQKTIFGCPTAPSLTVRVTSTKPSASSFSISAPAEPQRCLSPATERPPPRRVCVLISLRRSSFEATASCSS